MFVVICLLPVSALLWYGRFVYQEFLCQDLEGAEFLGGPLIWKSAPRRNATRTKAGPTKRQVLAEKTGQAAVPLFHDGEEASRQPTWSVRSPRSRTIIYIYIYICRYTCIHIYIYIYIYV